MAYRGLSATFAWRATSTLVHSRLRDRLRKGTHRRPCPSCVSAKPGANDRVGESKPVADDGGLLGVPVQALFDGDRDLLGGDAALDRLHHELGGVELLLAQNELGQDGGANGTVAVGAVGDVGAGDEGDAAVVENDARLPARRV